MSGGLVLQPITSLAGFAACEPLFDEYMEWLVCRLREDHHIILSAAEVQVVHADFRAEWPKLLGARGRAVVAILGGEPVGVATLKPISAEEVELKRLFVRPHQRGAGVGRGLLSHMIAAARSLDYRTMRLETFAFMTAAVDLYRSVGFVETPAFDGFEGASHGTTGVELFMRLNLASG